MAPSRITFSRTQVRLRADGTLRVGAVADTHSFPNSKGLGHLAKLEPDVILHAGDIGELACLEPLRAIAPVVAVRGNIDGRLAELPDRMTVELTDEAGAVKLRLLLMHIALYGPTLRAEAFRAARAESAPLLVCGHSHVPFLGADKGIAVFNPGSMGPRRFQLPILFGAIQVAPTGVTMQHIDCETGRAWEPA